MRYGIRVNALAPGYFETELNDDFFQEAAGQELIKDSTEATWRTAGTQKAASAAASGPVHT